MTVLFRVPGLFKQMVQLDNVSQGRLSLAFPPFFLNSMASNVALITSFESSEYTFHIGVLSKMGPRKGYFIVGTLLLLLFCSSIVLSNTARISNNNGSVNAFEITPGQHLPDHIVLADLIEIEYMAINGNDELLQMAKDNNWPGTGDKSDPIIIEGYQFRYNGNMFIVDGTELYWEFSNNVLVGTDDRWCEIVISNLGNCKISDNYFTRGSVGIHAFRVHDCQFMNNVFDFQSWDGVFLEDSYNNVILENTFIKEGEGGVLCWTDSHDNTILYNEVYGSPYGFLLWGDADGNTIQHNSIHDISDSGIDIQTADNVIENNEIYDLGGDGISVSKPGTEIRDNLIYHGEGYGIRLFSGSGDAVIENNVVIGFEKGGINLYESGNSYIESNDFYDNNRIQAWDYGDNNIFTDNYWHEWIANDTDENGILDAPKLISGGDNVDPRPHASPVNQIPAWYDFEPITGPPPDPEPSETTTTTTDNYTTTDPNPSTTTTIETNQTTINEISIQTLSIGVGVGAALLIVVIFVGRRKQL